MGRGALGSGTTAPEKLEHPASWMELRINMANAFRSFHPGVGRGSRAGRDQSRPGGEDADGSVAAEIPGPVRRWPGADATTAAEAVARDRRSRARCYAISNLNAPLYPPCETPKTFRLSIALPIELWRAGVSTLGLRQWEGMCKPACSGAGSVGPLPIFADNAAL